jgi:hypothetical protein
MDLMIKNSIITLLIAMVLCVPKLYATDQTSLPKEPPKTCKKASHGSNSSNCSSSKPTGTNSTSEKKEVKNEK